MQIFILLICYFLNNLRNEDFKMSIAVYLHKTHSQYADGAEIVNVDGKTIHECLDNLVKIHPGMKEVLFTEKGKLHPLIEVYLNLTSAYPDALGKEVNDGDKIHLVYTLAGG